MISLFASLALAGRPLGNVLIGNWSGVTKFSTMGDIAKTYNFIVTMTSSANFLETIVGDTPVKINVSSKDLSGNISFSDSIYYFNFTEKAAQYVAADIDMEEHGKYHCAISSYSTIHCTAILAEGSAPAITSIVFYHSIIDANKPWAVRNWKFMVMVVAIAGMQFGFKWVTKWMATSPIFRLEDTPKKKEDEEQQKKKEGEGKPKGSEEKEKEAKPAEKPSEKVKTD